MIHKPTTLSSVLNAVALTLWLTAWVLRFRTGKYAPKDPAGMLMIAGWVVFAAFLYVTYR